MAFLQVGDIKTRVKRQFGDESGVQIQDSDIYNWISDSLRHIFLNNEELFEAITTIDLVAAKQDYALPSDVITIKGITCKNSDSVGYFKLEGYQLEQFNQYVDGWDGTGFFGNGQPAIYTIFTNQIKLFPIPDSDAAAGLKIFYTTYLDEISSDVAIQLPKTYFNIILDFCLMRAYEMDEDWIAAEVKMQRMDQQLRAARGQTQLQQDSYPTITILDDDRW